MTLAERPQTEERFLAWTDWNGYQRLLEIFAERRIKITYDRGTLELLSPSTLHETIKRLLAQLVDTALFEKDIDYRPGGATTFRRELLDRGLEPDDCYFLSNLSLPDPEEEVPAPDLALEVEVTRSALNRMGIYQALGVPEVWRYTARHELVMARLCPEGYQEVEASVLLPGLPIREFPSFVQVGLSRGSNAMLRAFKTRLEDPRRG